MLSRNQYFGGETDDKYTYHLVVSALKEKKKNKEKERRKMGKRVRKGFSKNVLFQQGCRVRRHIGFLG